MGNRRKNNIFFIRLICCFLAAFCASVMSGCQIVEPEKRAYPLVIGIDWQEDQYQIYLGMARIAQSTGQGKEGDEEQQGDERGAIVLSGASKEEIMELYDQSQELYLDPGHVQAVILGKGLLADQDRAFRVLADLEAENGLGNSAYTFTAENLRDIFGKNGTEVESLGKFLAGIYENRTWDEEPVTLSQMYRQMHNLGSVAGVPEIIAADGEMVIAGNE